MTEKSLGSKGRAHTSINSMRKRTRLILTSEEHYHLVRSTSYLSMKSESVATLIHQKRKLNRNK